MNRQMKRMMQRQGEVGPDGSPTTKRRPSAPRGAPRPAAPRPGARQFLREVRGELRKVAWPSRSEVTNYSTVVLATLVILIVLIFVLDLAFGKVVLTIFKAS